MTTTDERVAIYIESDPLRVTVHPEAVVTDLGPQGDGIHDYRISWPLEIPEADDTWFIRQEATRIGGGPRGLMIWCARQPEDACAAVRAELAKVAVSPVHACPHGDDALTRCCGKTLFELPLTDRATMDDNLVTCR